MWKCTCMVVYEKCSTLTLPPPPGFEFIPNSYLQRPASPASSRPRNSVSMHWCVDSNSRRADVLQASASPRARGSCAKHLAAASRTAGGVGAAINGVAPVTAAVTAAEASLPPAREAFAAGAGAAPAMTAARPFSRAAMWLRTLVGSARSTDAMSSRAARRLGESAQNAAEVCDKGDECYQSHKCDKCDH